jgi:hypothetical protein
MIEVRDAEARGTGLITEASGCWGCHLKSEISGTGLATSWLDQKHVRAERDPSQIRRSGDLHPGRCRR